RPPGPGHRLPAGPGAEPERPAGRRGRGAARQAELGAGGGHAADPDPVPIGDGRQRAVAMAGRIVLLVTSPRLPAGLLTAGAWDAVRGLPVLAADESEQVDALRAAGVEVRIVPPVADEVVKLADPGVVWL